MWRETGAEITSSLRPGSNFLLCCRGVDIVSKIHAAGLAEGLVEDLLVKPVGG